MPNGKSLLIVMRLFLADRERAPELATRAVTTDQVPRRGPAGRARVGSAQAVGQVAQPDRVAVLDPRVGRVEELGVQIGNPDGCQLAANPLQHEVEVPLVARARVV